MNNRPAKLFAIDVDAAVRKLSEKRFKVSGESVVELIRLAASFDPERVEVSQKRGRLVVRGLGATPAESLIELTAIIFDPTSASKLKHRALSTLEKDHGLSVLAAFVGKPSRVSIEWMSGKYARGIEFVLGQRPHRFKSRRGESFKIEVEGRDLPRLNESFIESRCRYSQTPIFLGSERISRGLQIEGALLQVEVHNPRMDGMLGLPGEGDLTRIVRLERGIVKEEVVLPAHRGLVLSAVVEERDGDLDATRGTLRRAGKRLYSKLATLYDKLNDDAKVRAEELLFERYRSAPERELLQGVRVFRRVGGQRLDLFQVLRRARKGQVYAVDLDTPISRYAVDDRFVLCLSERQRRFLDSNVKVALTWPPRKAGVRTVKERLLIGRWRASRWLKQIIGGGPGREVDDDFLETDELDFLEAVRSEILSGGFTLEGEERPFGIHISMGERQRRPWARIERPGEAPEFRISRSHRLVQSMVEAFASDPGYIYPALILLTDGHDGFAESRDLAQKAILERHGIKGARR